MADRTPKDRSGDLYYDEGGGYPQEGLAAWSSQADKPAPVKKKKMSRHAIRKAQKRALANSENLLREAPTIGRKLHGGKMLVYDSELDEIDYSDPDDVPEIRDYMPIRFSRHGRLGVGGGVMYALFVISVSIILACLAWMCAADVLALNKEYVEKVVVIEEYEPTGDMPETVTLKNDDGTETEVPIQVDIDQVATALKNAGIIEYKWLFKIFSQFSHANIKMDPGSYSVSTELDYRALVTKMQFGSDSQETTKVTFPEGMTLDAIFELLETENVCKAEDLYEAAANYDFDYDFLEGRPKGDAQRLEGYLFPDTYEFYQGEAAEVTINRFLRNLDSKLTDEVRAAAEARGLSIHEVLTIASLIEKEAAGAEGERENMASAIFNRLAADMPLQIDATVNYVLGTSTLDLTQEQLATNDPYNTYVYKGLPPGPICSPGAAAINAAVNPADTYYYYWYSLDGETHFFSSYDEQQAFIANPY